MLYQALRGVLMPIPDIRKKAIRDTKRVTMVFDKDVTTWFRQMGRGYQLRINEVLRWYIEEIEKQDDQKPPKG